MSRSNGYRYTAEEGIEQDGDEYDSSLNRLDNVTLLAHYCDSIFSHQQGTPLPYPEIVSGVVRDRFYHGYSYYSPYFNPVGYYLEPLVKKGAAAIVIPDDILKFPYAACSQQSIVGMEVFKKKGYDVRKVSMLDNVKNTGHFAYEVYYDRGWHFFDTDQEPDITVLNKYHRPSAMLMKRYPHIAEEAYANKKDPDRYVRLMMSQQFGSVNKYPAPNAYIYQRTTKFLTKFGALIVLILMLTFNFYHGRRKKRAQMNVVHLDRNQGLKVVTGS